MPNRFLNESEADIQRLIALRARPFEELLPSQAKQRETGAGQLRAKYQAAIAENKRKSQKAAHQIPLIRGGPAFKSRAEYVLIQMYSQPPFRNNELKRYLESYVKDAAARKRILDAVQKNTNPKS